MGHVLAADPAVAANAHFDPGDERDITSAQLQIELAREILEAADIGPGEIDGVFALPSAREERPDFEYFMHEHLYDAFGIRPDVSASVNAGGAVYGVMLHEACQAISSGQADHVLCVGGGTMPSPGEGDLDMGLLTSHEEFEYPYGPFIPGMYGQLAQRYLHEYDLTPEDLSHVSVSTREWALENPEAIMHEAGPITVEDVMESGVIASPFRQLHCSIPARGGEAFLVTSGDRAEELTDQPAYVQGIGEHHTHGYIGQVPHHTETAAKETGKAAFEMAGLEPEDVDVAQIYDAFAVNPPMILEDLGFAEKGEGTRLFEEGRTKPGGDLPVNTHGGLLSYGHAGGTSIQDEAITQVRGTAGDRQIDDAETVLAHTYGGMSAEHVTAIFGRKPRQ